MADNRNWFLWLAQQGRELFVRRGSSGSSFDRIKDIIWKRAKSPKPEADPAEQANESKHLRVQFSPSIQKLYDELGDALLNFDALKVAQISDRIFAQEDIAEARGKTQYTGRIDPETGDIETFAFINGERNRGRIPPNRFQTLELVQAGRLEKARQRKLKGKPARFYNVPPPEPKVPAHERKVTPPEPKL